MSCVYMQVHTNKGIVDKLVKIVAHKISFILQG